MNNRRYYQIAGITIQVDADVPFTDSTYHRKFRLFEIEAPGDDVISIHHHFTMPEVRGEELGKVVYRKAPWAIYQKGESWVYLGIPPDETEAPLWRVAVFSKDHHQGHIYSPGSASFERDRHESLTLFPTDQILLARIVGDRQGCYIHSSAVALDGQGLVFVGHSEAGKSTVVKLLEDKAQILCDDRNIIRLWPEGFRVHGTWSHGDVPNVSPASAPLRAILFLQQAPENQLIPIEDRTDIFHRLLAYIIRPLVKIGWWEEAIFLSQEMARRVPCYIMRFDKTGGAIPLLERLCARPAFDRRAFEPVALGESAV